MILRRITEHVKAQNWFAVGLDFVIVVLGVFIGIQVANWNDGRADSARAVIYLERISSDLEADIINYQDSMDFWRQVSGYGRTGLEYVETKRLGDNDYWDILLAFYHASQVDEFITTQTSYDELTSAGELRLIADNDIRNAIANYYSSTDNPTLSLFPPYREHIRGMVPLEIQDYIWEHCYALSNSGQQQLLACDAPIDEQVAAKIVEQLSVNATLMSELRYWISNMRVADNISRSRIESAREMQRMIREGLGVEYGKNTR